MGMQDRDYYWEDRARRDKLPHVTAKSKLANKPKPIPVSLKTKTVVKGRLPTIYLVIFCVSFLVAFGVFKLFGY